MIPRVAGKHVLGVLLLLVAIPMSIAIGRRSLRGGARLLVLAGNLLAVLMIVPAAMALRSTTTYVDSQVAPQGLVFNGHPITNIYPYDANGHPLDHVRLFDSDGQPITPIPNATVLTGDGQVSVSIAATSAPAVPPPGEPSNDYPMPNVVTVYSDNGTPTTAVLPRPSFTVAPLPSASASPAPTASGPPSLNP